jgi:hypothetical protein
MKRITFCCFVLATLLALPSAEATVPAQIAWPIGYKGASTNDFIWDQRTHALVHSAVPRRLAEQVLDGLGGPPDPVFVAEERFVSVSACPPHNCGVKAFFWIDTLTGAGLGAIFHASYPSKGGSLTISSIQLSATQIPAVARIAIADWLFDHDYIVSDVEFAAENEMPQRLDASQFQPSPRFMPKAGGPGFDCNIALSDIEKLICSDPALAALDLAHFQLLLQIRKGLSNVPNRDEVTALDNRWKIERDAQCLHAIDLKDCLTYKYQEQLSVLMNWVPSRVKLNGSPK